MTDRRRIFIYIAFAFGIAWFGALLIALRGGLMDSPELVPDTGITEAFLIVATVYMFAPALAHLLTRLLTREGWQNLYLRPAFRREWRYWLLVWLGFPLLVLAGGLVYFLLFPRYFDGGLTQITSLLADFEAQSGEPLPVTPILFVVIQLIQAVVISPIINLVPILGEEFGWRAYLQPKLLPMLGARRTMIWMGVIWGIWHWPLIAMGHTFGLDYPGAPITGWLVFSVFTFSAGTVLGWATLKAGSVWPAVIGHGVLNGVASAVLLFTIGEPNPLVGPLVAGVVSGLPLLAIAVWLVLSKALAGTVPAGETHAA